MKEIKLSTDWTVNYDSPYDIITMYKKIGDKVLVYLYIAHALHAKLGFTHRNGLAMDITDAIAFNHDMVCDVLLHACKPISISLVKEEQFDEEVLYRIVNGEIK